MSKGIEMLRGKKKGQSRTNNLGTGIKLGSGILNCCRPPKKRKEASLAAETSEETPKGG